MYSSMRTVFFIAISAFVAQCAFMIAVPARLAHAQTVTGGTIVAETPAQTQARLQAELAEVEREEVETQATLSAAQAQSSSLQRDILILTTKIKAAQLNIKAKQLLIQTLGKDITQKQSTINDLQGKIDNGHDTLAQILRKTNELDAVTIPEVVLSQDNLSDIFSDFDTFQAVQQSLAVTFDTIRSAKSQTETEKSALDTRKSQESDALYAIQQDEKSIQSNQAEKQKLLNASKGTEKTYSQILAQKQAQAAQIRAALFSLAGGSKAIPFGDALAYANTVKAKTGVPQAFLLAILTQETGIGKNVGTCYLTNPTDGSGINARTNLPVTGVMKPTRDVTPFLSITSSLGLDYKSVAVSCPQSVGYGGGMGPAQFIASTWMLIAGRTATALNKTLVNPWNAQDAFMAAGIFLEDLGAGSTSYSAQKTAACKYYGGGTRCTTTTTPYGNNVMALAASIQANQIDPLQGL